MLEDLAEEPEIEVEVQAEAEGTRERRAEENIRAEEITRVEEGTRLTKSESKETDSTKASPIRMSSRLQVFEYRGDSNTLGTRWEVI